MGYLSKKSPLYIRFCKSHTLVLVKIFSAHMTNNVHVYWSTNYSCVDDSYMGVDKRLKGVLRVIMSICCWFLFKITSIRGFGDVSMKIRGNQVLYRIKSHQVFSYMQDLIILGCNSPFSIPILIDLNRQLLPLFGLPSLFPHKFSLYLASKLPFSNILELMTFWWTSNQGLQYRLVGFITSGK